MSAYYATWMPISTLPPESGDYLARWWGNSFKVARYLKGSNYWHAENASVIPPTHWMSLPDPPPFPYAEQQDLERLRERERARASGLEKLTPAERDALNLP